MTVDQKPSELSTVLGQLQTKRTDQFGRDAIIYVGWVDRSVAEGLLTGVTMDNRLQQLVGILMRGEQVLGGMVIPTDIGRRQDSNGIDWEARLAHASEKFFAAGYGVDQA